MSEDSIRDVAEQREKECRIEAEAFIIRLEFLSKTNWVTIVVPALLATFAGAAIFADTEWKELTGTAALLSALLTAIHKGRNCDAHQAECRRLSQAYSGLATRYRTIRDLDMPAAKEKMLELEAALAIVKETATAEVKENNRAKAIERLLNGVA